MSAPFYVDLMAHEYDVITRPIRPGIWGAAVYVHDQALAPGVPPDKSICSRALCGVFVGSRDYVDAVRANPARALAEGTAGPEERTTS